MSGPLETATSRKTTGNDYVPGSTTVQPPQSAAYDTANAQYNHDGNVVTGFVGVTEEYRTYATDRGKPLPVNPTPVTLQAHGDPLDPERDGADTEPKMGEDNEGQESAHVAKARRAAEAKAKREAKKADEDDKTEGSDKTEGGADGNTEGDSNGPADPLASNGGEVTAASNQAPRSSSKR